MSAFRVALTGGIASGKSSVSDLFARLGVPIVDADRVSRDLVAPGSDHLKTIIKRFGSQYLQADGQLNRTGLRDLIFSDARARKVLEAILHPAIRSEMDRLAGQTDAPYVLMVIPLLAETRGAEHYERVLLVDVDEQSQTDRLMRRDGLSADQASRILANQATRADRLAIADDILLNNSSLDELVAQVDHLHAQYLSMSTR